MLTRALKEVRSLLPVAGLIAGAAILAVAGAHTRTFSALSERVFLISFLIGTPLLAAASFGSEFQQRTLVLILSQPMARTRVWLEKWAVLVAVACALAAVQLALVCLGPLAIGQQGTGQQLLYLIAILCSAPFWTLVSRSTIGGLAFSGGALALLEMSVRLVAEYAWPGTAGPFEPPFAPARTLVAVLLAYSAITLWLGWRLFSRFQVTDVAYGDGSFSFGGSSWPVLHARPSGVLRNLVVKELWLHRPTLLVAAAFTICWLAALAILSVVRWHYGTPEFVFGFLLLSYVPLVTLLSGAVSVGEETSLGVRAWHLTLPVSVPMQWAVKFATSVLLCVALAIALPSALSFLSRSALSLGQQPFEPGFNFTGWFVILTVAVVSFWAASLVGHTIRAAVAAGILLLSSAATGWLVLRSSELVGTPAAYLWTAVMVRLQVPPGYPDLYWSLRSMPTPLVVTLGSLGTALALRQSFLAFKRPPTGTRTIWRNGAQLLAALAVVALCWGTFVFAWARQFKSAPVQEARAAVQMVLERQPDGHVGDERTIALGELDATGRLSAGTKHWLENTRIAVRRGSDFNGRRVYSLLIFFPHERKYRAGFVFTVPPTPQ